MSTRAVEDPTFTSEGAQEMAPRSSLGPTELLRELGATLRMSEAAAAALAEQDTVDDQTMILNMGPQHPSTHGVLRLMLELDGETVLRTKPIIGYLHTGMEKTGEDLTYLQGPTNVTRMDYASPFFNELVFSLATEKLLGIDGDIPPRATWIRMLLSELNRMSSHLLFMATNGMDVGAVGMMIYGWREREETLRLFEKITGLRMNHNFIRPGGVAADLPDGWRDDVLRLLDYLPPQLDEFDTLLTGQPIYRERLQGVGVITAQEATCLGATCPVLRSTGVDRDLRRDEPYLRYEDVDFDVLVGSYGDSFDRYAIRLGEIRESMRIVHQVLDQMPSGDYRIQDKKVTPPPRARIDESMVQGASGRGLRGGGEPPWRARLLPGLRRHLEAVPAAHLRSQLPQPADAAPHDARRDDRRRRREHLLGRPDHGRGRPLAGGEIGRGAPGAPR
jgi:NADH-quinone oxidoreductase subunit D